MFRQLEIRMETICGQPISSIIVLLNKAAKLRITIIFDKLANNVWLATGNCFFRSDKYLGL